MFKDKTGRCHLNNGKYTKCKGHVVTRGGKGTQGSKGTQGLAGKKGKPCPYGVVSKGRRKGNCLKYPRRKTA